MINYRQKLQNIDNTASNKDDNNTINNLRQISQRTGNNNQHKKNSSSFISATRDKFSVTNSFRRYTCQQCDRIFTDPGVLHQHSRSAHSGSRSHSCPECSKNFASSSGLKQHQHIHQSVKPFRCEVCLKAYTQFSNLCRHKRMHADCRQQIRCPDCGQAFSTLMSLNKHRRFCEGVLRRHTGPAGAANPGAAAACFLPLNGLDGGPPGSIVAGPGGTGIHPSLGALESWCMHLYGCRPSAATFPGYMACLPHASNLFPSQSMLIAAAAAAAQSSPLLLGSYMGLLPLRDGAQRESQTTPNRRSSSSSVSSSSAEKRRRSREQNALNREGAASVTSPEYQKPEAAERPEAKAYWSPEGLVCRGVKREKEEELEKEEEAEEPEKEERVEERDVEDGKNLHSPSESPRPERRTSESPQPGAQSPSDTGIAEDQQPLDLSTKTRAEVKSPLSLTSRLDPATSTPRSRSGTFEVFGQRCSTGSDVKNTCYPSLVDPSGLVASSTGFLSSVYHLRKELIASYGGRDHANGTYHQRPELDNIRSFVGKTSAADHHHHGGLQSTLQQLSPSLVRLPDILSFKSTKPRYRYSCRYCGKVFPRSANLTRHLRTHTGEQPYRCKYCKRCFSISSNLQRHVRNIHNKEKPFRCPLCERCFGQQTNLDRHVKKHDADVDGGAADSACFSSSTPVSEYPLPVGSRPREVKVKGHVEPYFKEIRNYFAGTTSAASAASAGSGPAFYMGRVIGGAEVTGSDEKDEEEDGEGGVGVGEDTVKIKMESIGDDDDAMQ